jgi:hypothetical protein
VHAATDLTIDIDQGITMRFLGCDFLGRFRKLVARSSRCVSRLLRWFGASEDAPSESMRAIRGAGRSARVVRYVGRRTGA